MIHFDYASSANTAVMSPLWFERVASSANSFPSLVSTWIQRIAFTSLWNVRSSIGVLYRHCIWWNCTGIRCHGFEVSIDGEYSHECKHEAVKLTHQTNGPHTIFIQITQPGRNNNQTDRMNPVKMKAVSKKSTKQSATILIQPVFIKGRCAALLASHFRLQRRGVIERNCNFESLCTTLWRWSALSPPLSRCRGHSCLLYPTQGE